MLRGTVHGLKRQHVRFKAQSKGVANAGPQKPHGLPGSAQTFQTGSRQHELHNHWATALALYTNSTSSASKESQKSHASL